MITFDHVTKTYPDGTTAVDHISLECLSDQVTIFVGPSGCGKTTSLRLINRTIEPTSGALLVGGRDVRDQDQNQLRRGIGYVIQTAGLFPHRTVLANITTIPRLLGTPQREAKGRAFELMQLVGLDAKLARRYPYQLSGGQQQRVGVARALAADPPVLLMDEPFAAVDPIVRHDLQQELLRIQAELSKTIVFVTHDIEEAILLADRVAVFRQGGHLAQVGTPEELVTSPANEFVESFLGAGRGIRSLQFVDGRKLTAEPVPMALGSATPEEVRAVAASAAARWVLITDPGHHPVGWFDASASTAATATEDALEPAHFIERDSANLRQALDLALLSRTGQVVVCDHNRQVVGALGAEAIVRAVHPRSAGASDVG